MRREDYCDTDIYVFDIKLAQKIIDAGKLKYLIEVTVDPNAPEQRIWKFKYTKKIQEIKDDYRISSSNYDDGDAFAKR